MSFEIEEGKVLIFSNKDKTRLKAPLVTGKAKIDGIAVKVAGWKSKEGDSITGKLTVKDGNRYKTLGTFVFRDNPSKDFEKAKENKQESKKPDKMGDLVFNNKELKLALWKREGNVGMFLSGSVQDKKDISSPDGRSELPNSVDKEEDPF